MRTTIKIAAGLFLAGLSAMPALCEDMSPIGSWQAADGESRYEVQACGDGQGLCARLTWLSGDARTDKNLKYLNTYVVTGASRTSINRWRGQVRYDGEVIGGSMTLVDEDTMKLSGCKAMFCRTLEFHRV